MKKTVSLLIALLLIAVPALAEGVQYASTANFLDVLDALNIVYDYEGIDSDGDEWIYLEIDGDITTIPVNCFFCSDDSLCTMRVWHLIDYDGSDYEAVLEVVNALNARYRFTCFYADTDDNSVTVGLDTIIRPNDDVGDICLEALSWLVSNADEAFPVLGDYIR